MAKAEHQKRKLWLLARGPDGKGDGGPIYDAAHGFVIRARTENEARGLANTQKGDEGSIWTDSTKTTCDRLQEDGEPEIILRDFNAG